ncbi:MAG: hypothetical protein ACK4E3_03325 [Brevundimonas sp.]|uniref:hypothetical protein n=1 Tax=Brevundimonas sp. TaxID=1871086 RepID=UPI00391BFD1C
MGRGLKHAFSKVKGLGCSGSTGHVDSIQTSVAIVRGKIQTKVGKAFVAFARIAKRRWLEWIALLCLVLLTGGSLVAPFVFPNVQDLRYAPALSVALTIGTSGIVAFIFYYVVSERIEARRRDLVKAGALRSYRNAKHDIAFAVIVASIKGGRTDLIADISTIERALTVDGFKALFAGGREADEGFYAFQNQMSDHTPEYDEIVLNLQIIGRAVDRLIDANLLDNPEAYNLLLRLDAMLRRIERNGAGYDESRLLCRFIWQIFTGWSFIDGNLGYDPIERAIRNA